MNRPCPGDASRGARPRGIRPRGWAPLVTAGIAGALIVACPGGLRHVAALGPLAPAPPPPAPTVPPGIAPSSAPVPLPAALGPAPDLPPQPGGPAAPAVCSTAPTTAAAWSQVSTAGIVETNALGPPRPRPPAEQIAVDPWTPCLMYRATSAQDLDRSTDGGQTWTRVLHDTAAAPAAAGLTAQPFTIRNITIPAPGTVVLAEAGNGDAVVVSRDAGASWSLINDGVAGQPLSSITFAPGSTSVAYATVDTDRSVPVANSNAAVDTAAGFGLYVTRDGGQSWSAAHLPALPIVHDGLNPNCTPCPAYPQLQVDPAIPGRIWMLVSLGNEGQRWTQAQAILESSDYGADWSAPITLPSPATQLMVTRAGGVLRLYTADYLAPPNSNTPGMPSVSTDDGAHWVPLPVQPMLAGVLVADPANPREMGYFGMSTYAAPQTSTTTGTVTASQVAGYYSTDAFMTAQSTPPLTGFATPIEPDTVLRGGSVSADPTFLAQADRGGSFVFVVHDSCMQGASGNAYVASCFGQPPASDMSNPVFERQSYWRFTPPGASGGSAAGSMPGNGGTAGGAGPGTPGAYPQLIPRRTCTVPQSVANPDGAATNGSLAFDGRYLLYTQYLEASGPTTGVIHRMDPATCADRGVISVAFTPSDMAAVTQRIGAGAQYPQPYIDTLSYDANHDALWFSLQPAPRAFEFDPGVVSVQNPGSADIVAIFRATLTSQTATSATAAARLAMFAPHLGNFGQGADLLAYDPTDDTLWTATWPAGAPHDGHSSGMPAHLQPGPPDGSSLPSCVNTAWGANPGGAQSPAADVIGSWTVGSPADIFVQLEDDITVIDIDKQSCTVTRAFTHRDFNEPRNEDEQMACDSLTLDDASALWMRDANTASLVAYMLPAGTCPFPTRTTYLGTFQASPGSTASLCASLAQRGAGTPLAGQPLEFTVNGMVEGVGTTDERGIACVQHPIDLSGGVYPVVVRFPGTAKYLASFDIARLAVPLAPLGIALGAQPLLPVPASGGTGTPPDSLPQQVPGGQSQAAEQAQAQAQTEAQSQSQAQAMSQMQPGMMVQRQRQERAAEVRVSTTTANRQALLASHRRSALLSGFETAGGVLMLGLMLVSRRPSLRCRTSSASAGRRPRSRVRPRGRGS